MPAVQGRENQWLQHINEVSLETDLISGEEILVVWNKVGVLRSVNAP